MVDEKKVYRILYEAGIEIHGVDEELGRILEKEYLVKGSVMSIALGKGYAVRIA